MNTMEAPARAKGQTEEGNTPLRVCFVCTGNTCRSPMAEAVANFLAWEPANALPESMRAHFTPAVEAFSAGIFARDGDPIAENAKSALENAGIRPVPGHDYRTHTARDLTDEDAEKYDLFLCVTGSHAMQLLLRFPQISSRVACLPEPVSDPFGGNEEVYRRCLEEITRGVARALFPDRREEESK